MSAIWRQGSSVSVAVDGLAADPNEKAGHFWVLDVELTGFSFDGGQGPQIIRAAVAAGRRAVLRESLEPFGALRRVRPIPEAKETCELLVIHVEQPAQGYPSADILSVAAARNRPITSSRRFAAHRDAVEHGRPVGLVRPRADRDTVH
jgi:hypothetical protein